MDNKIILFAYIVVPIAILIIGPYYIVTTHEAINQLLFQEFGNVNSTVHITFDFLALGFRGVTIPAENETIQNYNVTWTTIGVNEALGPRDLMLFLLSFSLIYFAMIANLIVFRDDILKGYLEKLKQKGEEKSDTQQPSN